MLTQQSKRLFELVENLLDLSRLEADSLLISPAEIDVREHLEQIVEVVVNGDLEQVMIEVPRDLRATVDVQALDRILSNLLANAVRHGAPPFLVSAASAQGELAVTIEDRGGGVAEEFVGSLFERFTRGATSSGTGSAKQWRCRASTTSPDSAATASSSPAASAASPPTWSSTAPRRCCRTRRGMRSSGGPPAPPPA